VALARNDSVVFMEISILSSVSLAALVSARTRPPEKEIRSASRVKYYKVRPNPKAYGEFFL